MSKLKERGANGVVLPQESVQQLQEINQHEYEERLKKAQVDQQIKASGNSSIASGNDSSLLINGLSSPEEKKSTNTFVRPRPTPHTDPSPFTRHLSLPYRSRPMGHHAFNSKGSSTYQALTDDIPPPRLQPESSSFESAHPQLASQTASTTAPPSQADMWLATATSTPAQGLLVTTVPNPFSTSSTTTTAGGTALSSVNWNQPQALNPFGADNFQTSFPPTTTQSAQPNPFAVDSRQEQFV